MEENTDNRNLVVIEGNVPLTTSYKAAEELGVKHRSLMQLIKDHQERIEKHFGLLRFENAVIDGRGQPEQFCQLTENQAHYVLTLSRNTEKAMEAKALFVKAFAEAKQQLADALAQVENFETMLDAILRAHPEAIQLMELRMLNAANTIYEIQEEQRQAKLQPKRIDYPLSEESKEVLDVLDEARCPVSAKELAIMLGKDEITVLKTIFHMACREEIKRVDDAYVSLVLRH